MKRIVLLFVIILSVLMVGGSSAQTRIRFFLTFIPNIQFSPVYMMDTLGKLNNWGYDLQIEHGDEPVGVDLIATGDFDFGMISGEQVLMARFGQRPVVMVYNWFQQYPVGIVIPNTTPATSVEELRGLRVGVPGRFGASYSALTALLRVNNMTEDDIQLQEIGFNAPDVICTGGVDASVVYINNEPLQVQLRADKGQCGDITSVSVIRVADYANMISNGVVTSETMLADNRELVQLVISQYDSALKKIIQNPAYAYLVSLEYVDSLPITDELRAFLQSAAEAQDMFIMGEPTPELIAQSRDDLWTALSEQFEPELLIQFHVLLETIKLWEAEQLGYSDEAVWAQTAQVLVDLGLLPTLPDFTSAYTNEFLP
jgi:NitT/TauT family transport system substrate-binding protein